MMLPSLFMESLRSAGIDAEALGAALSREAVTSIRFNAAKGMTAPAGAEPVTWARRGYYLDRRPVFTLDPALHQGRYYVQDASSMFIATVVERLASELPEGSVWLDACAAPGGKTTAAVDALPPGWLTVANEIVPKRAAVLRENIIKWGAPSVMVTRGATEAFGSLGPTFAIVAADVPCSGEGMMRKDAQAVAQWSPGLVAECAERQREILGNLWPALLPGGYLIYSTCTFNRMENDDMVRWLVAALGAEPVNLGLDDAALGVHSAGLATDAWRFLPHITRGEGLFLAVVRKPGGAVTAPPREPKGKRVSSKCAVPAAVRQWIASPCGMDMTMEDGRINVFPQAHIAVAARIGRVVDVIHHGVVAGHVKGRDIVPAHSLAMSGILAPEAFASVEVDRSTALSYLRREPVALPGGVGRGFVLLRHEGCPLGFVKNLGNRANNLYPAEWRILH